MAHQGPETAWTPTPGRLARSAWLLGAALAVAGVSGAAFAAGAAALSQSVTLAWVSSAMGTPLTARPGPAWAFHVAALATFVGVWFLGLALLVEGLFGIE